MIWKRHLTLEELNATSLNTMVGHLGIVYTRLGDDTLDAEMPVDARPHQPFGLLPGGASAALAGTRGAGLIWLSDVSGILDGKGQRIAEMTAAKAEQLIEQGIITDGMIVKVNAALDAARTLGRPVDIASWRHAEQLPALFNGMPMGTRTLA